MRRRFLLSFPLLFLACTPTWRDAVETAGVVGQQIACAICQRPVPAPPAVNPEAVTREDAIKLLAWTATMIGLLQGVVQRGAVETLVGMPPPKADPPQPDKPAEVKP